MKDEKKIYRIRGLMIISHLLLSLFVLFWLGDRYEKEKENLRLDLQHEFQQSEQKMLDSMIMAKMIRPFMGQDKVILRKRQEGKKPVMIKEVNDTVIFSSKTEDTRWIQNNTGNHDSLSFHIVVSRKENDSLKDHVLARNFNDTPITLRRVPGDKTRDKILVQGVKMLVDIVKDSADKENQQVYTFISSMDTTVLKSIFDEKAAPFITIWFKDSIRNSEKDATGKIFFLSHLMDHRYGVEIQGYTFYLLRKIFSYILFGLFLLGITATAFIVSYQSLKKQILLTRIRNDFVGNITHELKTPVTTVKVALEALQNSVAEDKPAKRNEYLQMAMQEMDRLDTLIQKVLETSLYHENMVMIQPVPLDLKEVLTEGIDILKLRLKKEQAQLTFTPEGDEFHILGDKLHLQGVLFNLIDNSLKYSGEIASISIKLVEQKEKILLHFSDQGPGIPREYHQKVFDRFFRVPSGNRHQVKGYGLGLFYVAMVMQQHQGSVRVENNTTKGCTFTLTFPKVKA